jgi:hypothetical protein
MCFLIVYCLLFSIGGQSQEIQRLQSLPNISTRHLIPGAIQLKVTPRGMEIFRNKLRNIVITQADLDPAEIGFEPITKVWDDPIKLDELKVSPQTGSMIKMIREVLSKWLVGFALNDIRPTIEMGDALLQATYNRFALVTDENLLRALGKTTGAVLVLELEIKETTFRTSYLNFFDLDNKFIRAKAEDVAVKIGGESPPLKVRIPFYVKISSQNTLEFEVLNFENNLNETNLELKYGNLIVPNIEIHIDDQVFKFNKKQLDAELTNSLPSILLQVRSFLANFASVELPKILNEKAQQVLVKKIEEIQPIMAPGAINQQDHFFWGLQLAEISQNQSLQVKLNVLAEDETQFDSVHTAPRKADWARGNPNFNVVPADSYDVAVSIDRGLINRLMQLSYERKFFEKIPIENNRTLKLTAAPVIDSVPGLPALGTQKKTNFIRAQVSLKVPAGIVTGLKRAAIKDEFEMSMEVIAKLEERSYPDCGSRPGEKGIAILLTRANTDSIVIDKKWMVFPVGKLLTGAVMKSVQNTIKEMTKDWATKGQSIGGCFSPPKELLGLNLNVDQLGMDPNGHLMIYFNYSRPGEAGI